MKVPAWLPTLLGVLTAVGPLSTDMYLPSFPAIEATLGLAPGSAQITLAAWFAGLAVGQILQGTLADRFGRRRPLLAGTIVFALANFGCILAPDLFTLCLFRFIAALGGSASMVIPRAIVRDLSTGIAAARLMAKLALVMAVAPIVAPSLGAAIMEVFSWHAIFSITTVYGAICAFLVWKWLPDTLPKENRLRLRFYGLASRYVRVGRDRSFMLFTLVGASGMFGMFAYLGGSPDVFINRWHLTPAQYALMFSCNAVCFILATQISPRLLPRYGAHLVLRAAVRLFLASTAVLMLMALTRWGGLFGLILPLTATMFASGFIMPNAAVGALSRQGGQAGTASALMGTLQFCLAAVSGVLVGVMANGTAIPMAALMLCGGVLAVTFDYLRAVPPPVSAAPTRTVLATARAVEVSEEAITTKGLP